MRLKSCTVSLRFVLRASMRRSWCGCAVAGCVAAWRRLRALQPGLVPPRALAGVAAIERMLRDFPLDNPQVTLEGPCAL